MKKAILVAAVVAVGLVGRAQGDEAQIFHLRGECNQLAKAMFDKFEEKADTNCIENFFYGSNYNAKDHRCYLQMGTLQDHAVSETLIEMHKATWCQRIIDEGLFCMKTLLFDVQTEKVMASAWSGKCEFNRDRNAHEKHGFFPESEKKKTFLGFDLSLSSEYARALDFIKSKMEENYRE